MKHNYSKFLIIIFSFFVLGSVRMNAQINFGQSNIDLNGFPAFGGITALEFGPDGKLYVAQYTGAIKILTIQKVTANNYKVLGMETLNSLANIQNHNDDGSNNGSTQRETTGIKVVGTALQPIFYVSSSDIRIGGDIDKGDTNLDTNSGIITRFTKNGSGWTVVDIVRGLPRSEENHATNGIQFTTIGGIDYLLVAQGGHTNGGGPSNNFAFITEYALSGAILSINLTALEALPILNSGGRNYIYDLPTVDDPTRANVNGITDPNAPGYNGVDINDPFGGNDGLNQAKIVPGAPVQIFSPGYRNAYDLVLTQSGALYVTDNGANQGWGGFPINEGTSNVNNDYDVNETGSEGIANPAPDGEYINNLDHLELITTNIATYQFGSYYGGHPNPIRANPSGAGLYTDNGTTAVFRTKTYDPNADGSNPNTTANIAEALPADWPPVPLSLANPVEGDWRGPGLINPEGPEDNIITGWGTNTNAITEYTAGNFDGAMQGNLLAGVNTGILRRVELEANGSLDQLTATFAQGLGGNALGLTAQGDNDNFPGTIWAGTLNGKLVILEPADAVNCIATDDPLYDPLADYDNDGYTNQDEVDNGTDACNGGSQPNDFDKSAGAPFLSDINDSDDDNDGIADNLDPFQLGDPATTGSDAFELPIQNDLLNDQQGIGGIFGLGMTGLMNNGATGRNWLDWIDRRAEVGDPFDANEPNPNDVLGGAPGIMTSHMRWGTAKGTSNDQEKAYQMGVQVDQSTGNFTIETFMKNFDGVYQLYGNTDAIGGEIGFFLGTGFQDNFVQFVISQNGLTAIQEVNDVLDTANAIFFPLTEADRPSSNLFLYIVVNPITGVLQFDYKIEDGIRQTLGTLTATGSTLSAIQKVGTDLAVGFIGTSNTQGVELEGSWEYLKVSTNIPSIVSEFPDLDRYIGTADEQFELDNFFTDDQGVANLSYSIESNTNASEIGAVILGNILTISYPFTSQIANITIRATDVGGDFVEQTFTVNVSDTPAALYRVNAGGPLINNIDGGIDWSADTNVANSTYLVTAGTNSTGSFSVTNFTGEVNQSTTPVNPTNLANSIFASERYDTSSTGTDIAYSFPVQATGNYEVRLYMANGFSGTSAPGQRIFDVSIENITYQELNNIDLSATYGHQTGAVISHIVNVTDGNINIVLKHVGPENPLINGIEILEASDSETPIYPNSIADQLNFVGDQLNASLKVIAYGGDGNLTYSISGQPDGVSIEPTNGNIIGSIEPTALNASPFNVTVTINDSDGTSSDVKVINFVWEIKERNVYRINAAGVALAANDNAPDWEYNGVAGAYQGLSYSVNTGKLFTSTLLNKNRHPSVPAYVNSTTFSGLFGKERYDELPAPEMMYNIPVENGDYVVNLYMGNSFAAASQPGSRIFDILLEGNVVENDLDLITQFGHNVAGMLSYPVTIADGVLNISFGHVVENPIISAIEVYSDNSLFPELLLNDVADQQYAPGEAVNFSVNASGGDSNNDFEYYISGQPEGISINLATGAITGTVAANAAVGGPNDNGLHQVTITVKKEGSIPYSISFEWSVTSTWINKNESENYTARHENSFVQAGDKFYLMGGRENAKTIDVYDYTSNTWASLVNSAPFEFNHFQATEYEGLIWVIGSFKDNAFPNETPAEYVWSFDPANEEWIQGPQIPTNRRRGSAGLVMYNNKFYIVAGNTLGHNGGYVPFFDEFDPATGQWTPLADAPRSRDHFASVVIGNKMYVSGGRLSGGAGGTFAPTIAEVDVYDFIGQSWTTLPAGQNIPTPRGGSSAVNFNDKLMVIGGETATAGPSLTTVEEYDPVAQAWSTLPALNSPRHGTQAIVSGNGIFILAGSPVQGGGSQKNMEYFGEDAPVGSPSVASALNTLDGLLIADGATETINVEVENGNVGIIVTSMVISGANAIDFSIVSGELTNQLLSPNSSHSIEISLAGIGANRNAILTITYGNNFTKVINLSNAVNAPQVTNPGTQNNGEGDIVSLQIDAIGACTDETYSAAGLPQGLTIDSDTGLITGTVSAGGSGNGAYQESNGLVVIEMENLNFGNNWSEQTSEAGFTGDGYLFNSVDSFGTPGIGTITTQVDITTPGVYRFQWYNKIGIIAPSIPTTEHNDAWLRFNDADDFYGAKNTDGSGSMVFPKGLGKTPEVEGASSNGWLKVYTNTIAWSWSTKTSDNDAHFVFVEFDNPGTYTMEISSRSDGHLIDRATLHKVDQSYTTAQLLAAAESSQGGGSNGAADNSPYSVEVTVADNCVPSQSTVLEFVWNIGEAGNQVPMAVAEADVTSGDAPLTVSFTGSNSTDDTGVTGYIWDFKDGTPTVTTANPTHEFGNPGVYEVELTVSDGVLTNSTTLTITVNTPVNQTPVVTNPGVQNGIEGDVVSLQIVATDSDDDVLSYAATNLPTGLTMNTATGLISGTISIGASTNSPYAVAVTVTDNGTPSESTTVSFAWNITDVVVNLAPVVTNPGVQNGVEGDVVSLQVVATDLDDDVLSYVAINLPTGLSINTSTGLITGTIATGAAVSSPYTVTVTVMDNGTPVESAEVTFTWNVTDVVVNLAPVVTNPGMQNGVEGDVVSLQVAATDPEGDVLSYAATNLPTGLAMDTATGLISGTISIGASTNSPYAVEVMVTDNGTPSESAIVSFTWNVTANPVNMAPVAIAIADVDSGPSPLSVNFTGSNSTDDTGIISYLWDFGTGEVSTLENPTYIFEMQGMFEVTLTVVDGEGLEGSVAIIIEVNDNITLENPDGNSMVIAPNPAGDSTEVWVELIDNTEVLGMYIYDLSGRLVQNYNLIGINSSNGSYSVNTSNLHNGVYSIYIFISGETKPLVSKLVVRH